MNQKWKTVLISVLTPSSIISGIALAILWGYFSRIDRLDVFFEVMNIKSIFLLIFFAAVFSLAILLLIFFVISIFIPVVIPSDISNLVSYNKIQNNFLTTLMLSGFFPMVFIYFFYYALNVSEEVKNNSFWLSMLSIGLLTIAIAVILNRKHLEHDLSSKSNSIKWKIRCRIYLAIPLCIAFLSHLQVFPLEIVFRNITASFEEVNLRIVAGLAFMSYMVFFLTLLPGLVYIRMDASEKFVKKISASLLAYLMILLLISTKITVLPVMFTHSVIKLSGISDFSTHKYVIKMSEYPEELFSHSVWSKKIIKEGEYYSIQAVSMFTTAHFSFLCPKEILQPYRESWKFDPLDAEFDSNVRLSLQKEAAYCVPISSSAVKRWDIPHE